MSMCSSIVCVHKDLLGCRSLKNITLTQSLYTYMQSLCEVDIILLRCQSVDEVG